MRPRTKTTFILDTNVLLDDPQCFYKFDEHDLILPTTVLEELDHLKKGSSDLAVTARQVIRNLSDLAQSNAIHGVPIPGATGRLHFLVQALAPNTNDNRILDAVRDSGAVLVTKDINLRIKALALGLEVEDYQNDRAIEDADILYTGVTHAEWPEEVDSWREGAHTYYMLHQQQFHPFQGVVMGNDQLECIAMNPSTVVTATDYRHHDIWGIRAKNRGQNFALNLLMNPKVEFVSLMGGAGSGKTFLALAAALAQTLDKPIYTGMTIMRATVPVDKDIGYLPGTEEEKLAPWMRGVKDNLDQLINEGEGVSGHTEHFLRTKVTMEALSYIRGRSFVKRILLIDEAQNLSKHQVRTIVTRAGEGTKVIMLGNLAQIDSPYVSITTSGLTHAVQSFKACEFAGHVTLEKGERSKLASYAAKTL